MEKTITCKSVSVYRAALTRGRHYSVVAHDEQKRQVRVCGDNGRARWFGDHLFEWNGATVPTLTTWRFDDLVRDEINQRDENFNWVDVILEFDDGTKRWCSLTTPGYLKWLLENRAETDVRTSSEIPGIWSAQMIVAHDLHEETVDRILRYMDQHDALIAHSSPVGNIVEAEEEEDTE